MSIEGLEKRIQMLEDLEAIKKLKFRYAELCDTGYDPDRLASLFTENAVFILTEHGVTMERTVGKEKIRQRFVVMPQRITFAVHNFTDPTIEVGDNKAEGRWYMWALQTLGDGLCTFGCGVYHDKYEKVNGQWMIAETHLSIFFRAPYGKGWGEIKLAPPPEQKKGSKGP